MNDTFSNIAIPNPDVTQNNEGQATTQKPRRSPRIKQLDSYLSFTTTTTSSHLIKVSIQIDTPVTQALHNETIKLFKQGNLEGFTSNNIPAEYIQEHYKSEISKRVKTFLFRHVAIEYLLKELAERKILYSNYPRLTKVDSEGHKQITFHFDISLADPIELKEWKHFAFKSPKRKKYKDLDKQVIVFLENETAGAKKLNQNIIEDSDWVCFEAQLINDKKRPIIDQMGGTFWCKIKTQNVPDHFSFIFLNKHVGETLITNRFDLSSDSDIHDGRQYNFSITIKGITKGKHLNLEHFKSNYKLKNKVEIHNKLMEVFSYRNDISQRKTIIEEIFHLFLAKHRFEVPKHLVLRRQEDILLMLMKQPDYQVYKSQKDFSLQVELLAEKQLKEEILIDQISYQENIKSEMKDVIQYLYLFNNKRLREFIYFKPLLEQVDDADRPINSSILAHAVNREKTLNYIILTLTR